MRQKWTRIVLIETAVFLCVALLAFSQWQQVPEGTTLFGEPIPSNDTSNDQFFRWMNWHFADNTGYTTVRLARLTELDPYLTDIFVAHNLHPDFKYLLAWESGLDARANSGKAVGFAQFIPSTARRYGLYISPSQKGSLWKNKQIDIDERCCPKAFEAAANYLADIKEERGNKTLTAAEYNSETISLRINEQSMNRYWGLYGPKENEDYIFHILAIKLIYEGHLLDYPQRPPITFQERIVRLKKATPLHEVFTQLGLSEQEYGNNIRWNRHIIEGVVPPYQDITIYIQQPYPQQKAP